MLLIRLWCVGAALVAAIVIGVLIRVYGGEAAFGVFKDLLPAGISIAAVYLAHVFQQRSMFVQSLRELWSKVIYAKNELVAYANLEEPKADDFAIAYRAIATAIDEVRGVYRNVGENEKYVGYFPYEPLHDMRKALDELRPGNEPSHKREFAGAAIQQAWNAMRFDFLSEFDTPEPTQPIVNRNARRTQESGTASSYRGGKGSA